MGLFEELSARYPVENIPPVGDCLVIPSNEFKAEWETKLRAEGCRIFSQAYNGRICFFVRKPIEASKQPSSQPVSQQASQEVSLQPPAQSKGAELTEKIRELRMKGFSYRAIAKELHISPHTVYKRLRDLGLNQPIKSPEPKRMADKADRAGKEETDSLGELIEALRLLHQHGHRKACMILIRNADSFLEAPS